MKSKKSKKVKLIDVLGKDKLMVIRGGTQASSSTCSSPYIAQCDNAS